jgi:Nucleotidyl transferase AbiEii toxin, Type IV TA system
LESPADLLVCIARVCEDLDLTYAVGGSIASMAYGEPRYTRDIDVVVQLTPENASAFAARFPRPDFYVDHALVLETAQGGGQFNIIHIESGMKIDIYVPVDSLQHEQLTHARVMTPLGVPARVSGPEELIVMKMRYYALGDTERHLRDVASMLRVSGAKIDRARITKLADELGLSQIWEALRRRLDEGDSNS